MEPKHIKHRLEQFSDGVFAIAITLLALGLHIPVLSNVSISKAIHELIPLIPNILTFVLSFGAIAIFWVNHHQLSQSMGPVHHKILWINMAVLFFITLIPFVTEAASVNPLHPLAILTYSLIMFATSASFTLLRYLVHKSNGETCIPMTQSMIGPIFYFLAIIAACFSVWIAYVFLIVPPLFYFLPKSSVVEE